MKLKLIYCFLIFFFFSGHNYSQGQLDNKRSIPDSDYQLIENLPNKILKNFGNQHGKFRPSVVTHGYDAMSAPLTLKRSYTYDNNGNVLTDEAKHWYYGRWVNNDLYIYTYDNNGNLLTRLHMEGRDSTWQNRNLNSYTYTNTTDGKVITVLQEIWSDDKWTKDYRYTYTFDNSGNLLTLKQESGYTGSWVNLYLYTYTYDNNGHILTSLSQTGTTSWDNWQRNTYTYDNNGKMLSNLQENWDGDRAEWKKHCRDIYTYDDNGRQLVQQREYWGQNAWVQDHRSTYTYNNNNNVLTELMESWKNGVWNNFYYYIFSYDDYGNAIKGESYKWLNNQWSLNSPYYNLTLFYNNGNDYYAWSACSIEIQYKDITATGIDGESVNANSFELAQNYPNPFNPSTNIKFNLPEAGNVRLDIYNSLGQKVAELINDELSAGEHDIVWNASQFSSGVYFCKLLYADKALTKKLILAK